jgi:hypothetical protein
MVIPSNRDFHFCQNILVAIGHLLISAYYRGRAAALNSIALMNVPKSYASLTVREVRSWKIIG